MPIFPTGTQLAPRRSTDVLGSFRHMSGLGIFTTTSHPPEDRREQHVPQKFRPIPSLFLRLLEASCKQHVPQESDQRCIHSHFLLARHLQSCATTLSYLLAPKKPRRMLWNTLHHPTDLFLVQEEIYSCGCLDHNASSHGSPTFVAGFGHSLCRVQILCAGGEPGTILAKVTLFIFAGKPERIFDIVSQMTPPTPLQLDQGRLAGL